MADEIRAYNPLQGDNALEGPPEPLVQGGPDRFAQLLNFLSGTPQRGVTQGMMPMGPHPSHGGIVSGIDETGMKAVAGLREKFPKVFKAVDRQAPWDFTVEGGPVDVAFPLDWQWHVPVGPETLPAGKVQLIVPSGPEPGITQTAQSGLLQQLINVLYRTRNRPINSGKLGPIWDSKIDQFGKPYREALADAKDEGMIDHLNELSAALAERMMSNSWKPRPMK